jgi:hypothetical protein
MADRRGSGTRRTGETNNKSLLRRNVGGIDRAVRLAVGILLLPTGLFLLTSGYSHGMTITILGIIGLATGTLGACPLYIPFGISTVRAKVEETVSSAAPRETQLPGSTAGRSGI